MKASEYIKRAKEAIAVGISDKRWGYAAEHGEFPPGGDDCGLCDLDNILAEKNEGSSRNRDFCPIQYAIGVDDECDGEAGRCCREWLQWCGTYDDNAKAAACAMIARLQSLDVEGCADALVRDGILEAD